MITRQFAEWASALSFKDLPEEVVAKAKYAVIDHLGAAFFTASNKVWGKVITDFALLNGGQQPEATVIGSGRQTIAERAALANGTLGEGYELGDAHFGTATRPGPMTIPAALALCEARDADGKGLIEAVVVAYELNIRIGMAIRVSQRGAPMLGRGLYMPTMIGTFAAAAGGGRALGLDVQKMTWALGIAGSLTGGYFQGHEEGAWTRRLNGGIAPSRGVLAAQLAESGFVGPERPLEGEYGWYRVFANGEFDADVLTDGLGTTYGILQTWFKAYPMNGTLHSPVMCLLQIMRENDLQYTDLRNISAGWHQYVPILAKKDVHEIVSAQFSLPYALAVASVQGDVTVDSFTREKIEDPTIRGMMDKIDVRFDPSLIEQDRESAPGSVTVETNDGRTYKRDILFPKGHARDPMSIDEMRAKFAVLTKGGLTTAEQDAIWKAVMNLENIQVRDLMKLCKSRIVAADA